MTWDLHSVGPFGWTTERVLHRQAHLDEEEKGSYAAQALLDGQQKGTYTAQVLFDEQKNFVSQEVQDYIDYPSNFQFIERINVQTWTVLMLYIYKS